MANKQIKFQSFFGYAANSAKDGEKVGIAFQINCRDHSFADGMPTMIYSALDDFVYPEAMRRIQEGNLTSDFRLRMAHILLHADESKNDILLNDEVRFKGLVKFEDGKKFKHLEPVTPSDINEILGLYASEKNDPNAAHVMLIKFKSKWLFACDLVYDREKVRKRFDTSKQFLANAKNSMEQQHWGPFVDNLFSSTELAIQSVLLLHHNPKFSTNQDHDKTKELFAAHATNGNIDIKFSDHYEKLSRLRKQGRYLIGVHGNSFIIDAENAKELLKITNELIEVVEKWMATVDFNRKPPAGEYVAFGVG